jgi:GntR family transcriptional regulator
MPAKMVNGAPMAAAEWSSPARPSSRYSTLARALIADVESGRYAVGDRIPTEAELQQRFGVSRHTVREALRELKNQGMLAAHPGIGTVVRAKSGGARFGQGVSTLRELIQFVEATRMHVAGQRELIADREWTARLDCKAGQQWIEASVLRHVPPEAVPIARLFIYLRPEHRDVVELIDRSEHPVFHLIERHHGVRVAEVRQEIVAVTLDARTGRLLRAPAGAPALQITRHYYDAQDRVMMVSVGQYPSDRFSHTTKLRVQPRGEAGSRASGE